jgi:HK97 family phage prohead protease
MNAPDARFCGQCGNAMRPSEEYSQGEGEDVQCPQCERYNDDDSIYCDQCGQMLEGSTAHAGRSRRPRRGDTAPRENLVRGIWPIEFRSKSRATDGTQGDSLGTLFGHFAVFNRWTKIDSLWEGEFMESIKPGAFRKTIQENGQAVRCLFSHGMDYVAGDKPLGPIRALTEDKEGAYYEVDLMDTSYNRDLLPGLKANLYGASFRFRAIKEDFDFKPGTTDWNPEGIPARQVQEAELFEFGPTPFPAYADASAGMRSLTDQFIEVRLQRLIGDPSKIRDFILGARQPQPPALAPRAVGIPHSQEEPSRVKVVKAPSNPLSLSEFLEALEV